MPNNKDLDSYEEDTLYDDYELYNSYSKNNTNTQEKEEEEKFAQYTKFFNEEEKLNEKIQKKEQEIEDKKEFIEELSSPLEKREFVNESIENIRKDEKINEALDYKEVLEMNEHQSKQTEKELNQTQENIKNAQEKLKELEEKKAYEEKAEELKDSKHDENYYKKYLEEQEKELERLQKELEKLKEERERLQDNFNKSLENLLNSTDLCSLTQTLKEMDKALALLTKQTKQVYELKAEERQKKLEKALTHTPEVKEVVKEFIHEMYETEKTLKEGRSQMDKEKDAFIELDKMIKKDNLNLKDIERLEHFYKNIDEKSPHFKENYPKSYEKGLKTIKTAKEKLKTQFKEQNQGRSL
ncbi:hypothetical protein [Campylobacter cuniculorum]|uniref:Uncharacterized protein n=2 Tax=Campylobacter cuniculorum TaxID=374106 RepID=A0A1W6BYJ0_9BACT|nr:hypothetical protein [Campylobacter cuniculorum]ARJ57100.1 hypothetical protein CCUN_1517 [Campylobacter cuniculorum DSM 23162 = LMG 24588]QOR04545.1 hypothetical protein A0071_00930 [Campylobacter cuniculorum]